MNSTLKGDKLEDAFHQYLLDQQVQGQPVFGVYHPDTCKIFKKKSYFDKEREADVTFDVVIEVTGVGRSSPHLFVVFECKNYDGNIPEDKVTDFSDKLGRIFRHGSKGILVVSTRLQSGADKIARSRKMGIVKFDQKGVDVVADRRGGFPFENGFIKSQIYRAEKPAKSLKFSAYHDGRYFGSMEQLLGSLDPELPLDSQPAVGRVDVPYLSPQAIKESARVILKKVGYSGGRVDLERVCSALSLELRYSKELVLDADGTPVLGSAVFDRDLITINSNENPHRERFTLGHEIGHFCLGHKFYLKSETIVERDLLIKRESENSFHYERLEQQANAFSGNLLLPDEFFINKTEQVRQVFGIKDRGHGYIFVDDQPQNHMVYLQLLLSLAGHFGVSKRAVEIKLRQLDMLTDRRRSSKESSIAELVAKVAASGFY